MKELKKSCLYIDTNKIWTRKFNLGNKERQNVDVVNGKLLFTAGLALPRTKGQSVAKINTSDKQAGCMQLRE